MLSGATDLEKLPEPADLCEPMRWIWRGICADLPTGPRTGVHGQREGREVRVRSPPHSGRPRRAAAAGRSRARPGRRTGARRGAAEPALLDWACCPPRGRSPVSRLSYSGLESYRRCGYRFYLERALAPAAGRPALRRTSPLARTRPSSALLRGTLVHESARAARLRPAAGPERATRSASWLESHGSPVRRRGGGRPARHGGALRRLGALRDALARGPPRAHRAALRLHPHASGGGRAQPARQRRGGRARRRGEAGLLVVDYKSDPLEGPRPGRAYGRVLLAPSASSTRLPALRSGAERVEVVHCFLERPDEPAVAAYAAADAERARGRAARAGARGGGRALRAHRRAAPRAVRRLPRPQRALFAA